MKILMILFGVLAISATLAFILERKANIKATELKIKQNQEQTIGNEFTFITNSALIHHTGTDALYRVMVHPLSYKMTDTARKNPEIESTEIVYYTVNSNGEIINVIIHSP